MSLYSMRLRATATARHTCKECDLKPESLKPLSNAVTCHLVCTLAEADQQVASEPRPCEQID
jgi:hypothetical protein